MIFLNLSRLIHVLIDPVYRLHSGLCARIKVKTYKPLESEFAPKQAKTFEDLKKHVFPMLLALGPHAQSDPTLLYKILRLCKSSLGIQDAGMYSLLIQQSDSF